MVLDVVNQLKLRSTILDGGIVALDSEGIPRFQLKSWPHSKNAIHARYEGSGGSQALH
jgi:ATP-dependent DNA ligase